MTRRIKIVSRSYYEYSLKQHPEVEALAKAVVAGDPVWFEFQDGARKGSIAKVLIPDDASWCRHGFHLPKSFTVEVSEGKTIKVGTNSYHNNLVFLLGYTGTYVTLFQKGQSKAKPTETSKPDLLGNTIKVGDWVIFSHKHGGTGLGKLNRLSEAGNAWVMTPDKRSGNDVEVMTEGAGSLIKVSMTQELHSTVMLCDSLQNVRTKLVIDLDHEAYQ